MLDAKKTEYLFRNSYISYVGTAFGAVLVTWFLYRLVPPELLFPWFFLFLVLTLARSFLTYSYYSKRQTWDCDTWWLLFLAGAFASGLFWGMTGFLLVPVDTLPLTESVLHHGMLLLFIAVLIAASVITYSVSQAVYFCFALPAVLPQCLMLIHKGDSYHSFLGGFMLAFAVVVFVISVFVNRMLLAALATQEENEQLRLVLYENDVDIGQVANNIPGYSR